MLLLRFYVLTQVYHWSCILHMNPVSFLLGVLFFFGHLAKAAFYHPSLHAEMVLPAIQSFKGWWEIPGALPTPPAWVKRKMLALEADALKA